MGQQQLLLIILGVIIVGIAVAIGVTLFQDNAVSSNRDAMTTDLIHLSAKARQYYYRPASMGGGSHSFVGLTADAAGLAKLASTTFTDNANGTYSVTQAGTATDVVISGTGKTALADGSFPIIRCTVTEAGQTIAILN